MSFKAIFRPKIRALNSPYYDWSYKMFQLTQKLRRCDFGITGGPGSGKGTQCDRICVRYGYTHMSSGDLLRNEVMSMSERGRKLYQLMSKGENVPNSEVDQLLVEAMVSSASKSKVNCNS